MNLTRRSTRHPILALTGLAALALVGCNNGDDQLSQFRRDPTPEVMTLSQRPTDVDNRLTVTNDTNLRMFNEDFGRVWLMERPSRLSPVAIPY